MNQDFKEYMKRQPIINVGMGGHVSDGKSTTVEKITQVHTQKFKSEQERNITIKLGYANAKIWRCPSCNPPEAFSSSGSSEISHMCKLCESDTELVIHVSFVDCPGHSMLTSTMMNGSAVMDYIILVESARNEIIPAPQTEEHLLITKNVGIVNKLVLMNKIDIVKREDVEHKIKLLRDFIKTYSNNPDVPIIPISASFNLNIDVVCEYISRFEIPSTRDINGIMKMIVVRSFDINKAGIDVTKLNGGVIGGTIMKGRLKINDRIMIFPGVYKKIYSAMAETHIEPKKDETQTNFSYTPLSGEVLSIHSDKTCLDAAISGGLLGIQLTIDPAYTRQDNLTGSLVVKYDDFVNNNNIVSVYDKIVVVIETILIPEEDVLNLFTKGKSINININSNNIKCEVFKYGKKKKELGLIGSQPIIVDTDNPYLTIMIDDKHVKIIGKGKIIDGITCQYISE